MWMFLGLGAAVAAASMADIVFSRSIDTEDDDEAEGSDKPERTAPNAERGAQSMSLFKAMLNDEQQSDDFGNPASGMGLFDHLSERIHSSDMFPPEPTVSPVFLKGGDGPTVLRGSVANDTLEGGPDDDTLLGSGGDNLLIAGGGNNHLIGGEGDDTVIGGAGDDTLEGGWGNDLLMASGGNNVLMGGAGNDTLVGAFLDAAGKDASGQNFLNGGAGDDLLIAGQGDIASGGEGANTFALGDWLKGVEAVTIMDYSPAQDQIVLHYDPEKISLPEVSVTFQADKPDLAEIRLNGYVVAYVVDASGLSAKNIALVAGHPAYISQAAE